MIPFIDLQKQRERIDQGLNERIRKTFEHGKFILGPEVNELEESLANDIGVNEAVGCASGTDALYLAMKALGVGPGDEVIIPDFSFFATAEAVVNAGATPVFADISPTTFLMGAKEVESCLSSKTKAIIPVSLYGACSQLEELEEFCREKEIYLIEDGAQSFGASVNGRKSLSFGDIGCTSFFPAKPLGCYGDGGACFTNSEEIAEKLKVLRAHGQTKRYYHEEVGINSRLDSVQAAILLEKFSIFDDELKDRQEVASVYYQELEGVVDFQAIPPNSVSVYGQFTIRVDRRDELKDNLKEKGIPTTIHYPFPLSHQPALRSYKKGEHKHAEIASREVISLPMHPYLEKNDQLKITEAIKDFFRS